MSRPLTVHVGDKFGKWTVVGEPMSTGKARRVLCRCECGAESMVEVYRLYNGESASCTRSSCCNRSPARHGRTPRRVYRIWKGMVARCSCASADPRNRYRRVGVCENWRRSFEAFRDWSLKHGYADDLTIDRIRNDEGYSPYNCRWTTRKAQMRNTSVNHMVEVDGDRMCLAEAAERFHADYNLVHHRIRAGWSVKRALTEGAHHG